MASVYGLMRTAWGFAGVFGPMLIATMRQSTGRYGPALIAIGIVMLCSAVIPLVVRPPYMLRKLIQMPRVA